MAAYTECLVKLLRPASDGSGIELKDESRPLVDLTTAGSDTWPMTREDEAKALVAVVNHLAERFPDLPRSEIETVVAEEHGNLNSGRIRDYVPLLVEHAAKKRLGKMVVEIRNSGARFVKTSPSALSMVDTNSDRLGAAGAPGANQEKGQLYAFFWIKPQIARFRSVRPGAVLFSSKPDRSLVAAARVGAASGVHQVREAREGDGMTGEGEARRRA